MTGPALLKLIPCRCITVRMTHHEAVTVRPAEDADRPVLLALMRAQFREHHIDLSDAGISRAIEGVLREPSWGRILVATLAGTAVGFAALSFMWTYEHGGRAAWLDELYVEPAHRGGGIGQVLLRSVYQLAAECGAVALDLEVEATHRRVEQLYARQGFARLDRSRWSRPLATQSHSNDNP
jgi:GNAT superfamily N-acetyltransferase